AITTATATAITDAALSAAVSAEKAILVAEDDPNNSEVLLELLSNLGYAADFE
ncbi:MAG: hypothetical protein HC910_22190, partial [Spirulinaceae cyanobacterium SM2_1_0]|nr:hypothetical protein [Spirulinaceae cyanobacterium SM2_1_0]